MADLAAVIHPPDSPGGVLMPPPPAQQHGAAPRGYEKRVEDDLHDLGVRTVVILRKGKPGKARQAQEHRPAFRRTIKW